MDNKSVMKSILSPLNYFISRKMRAMRNKRRDPAAAPTFENNVNMDTTTMVKSNLFQPSAKYVLMVRAPILRPASIANPTVNTWFIIFRIRASAGSIFKCSNARARVLRPIRAIIVISNLIELVIFDKAFRMSDSVASAITRFG